MKDSPELNLKDFFFAAQIARAVGVPEEAVSGSMFGSSVGFKLLEETLSNDYKAADTMMRMVYDHERRDVTGWTLLHFAVAKGNTDEVKRLLGEGADVTTKDELGRTPMDVVSLGRKVFDTVTDEQWGEIRRLLVDHVVRESTEGELPTM